LFATLSVLWSADWRTSLYIALHLWLLFLFILSLRDWREAWRPAMLGFCAALSIQIIASFVEFAAQSTHFLLPLHSNWPGPFDPSVRGVSVVQFADGIRVLRAYGTTPHPNILGGFLLLALLGPTSIFLANKKPNYLALVLLCLGIIALVLTFSRSAWLGFVVVILLLFLKSGHFDRRHLFLLLAASALTFLLTVYSLRDLVFTRVSGSQVETEQLSRNGRSWLNQQGLETLRQYPLTGVGIGAFIITLSKHALEGAPIEPVHNILLLAGTELGVFGMLILIILFVSIAWKFIQSKTRNSILSGVILAGLGVIGLFDHFLWTLAPGRVMLALAFGLWAGSIKDHAA
ncbi:MAG TPA: O-antigen ligase family protein, partial [Anaerolineales bacterium]|nr:O-antigen ligase family protein [Anaerolineales bacterium]